MMLTEYNEEETRKSFFEEGRAEGEARAKAAFADRESGYLSEIAALKDQIARMQMGTV